MYYIATYNNDYGLCISKVDNKSKTVKYHYPVGKVGHPFINGLSKHQKSKLLRGRTIIINKNNSIIREVFK